MEEAGKYGDRVRLVLAVLAFPPPQGLQERDSCGPWLRALVLWKN